MLKDLLTNRPKFSELILNGLRKIFSFGKRRINEPEVFEEIQTETIEETKVLKRAQTKDEVDSATDRVLNKF